MTSIQPFTIERTLNAPAEKVWKAITDKEQMKQWYFDIAEFEPTIGFEFTFSGENYLVFSNVIDMYYRLLYDYF